MPDSICIPESQDTPRVLRVGLKTCLAETTGNYKGIETVPLPLLAKDKLMSVQLDYPRIHTILGAKS